ncbi:MAG: hypothetical protein ACOYJG_03760 [Prevotella sp.]|jgi:hypothetical protein
MKQILLSLAFAAMMPIAANAQWISDTGNGINIWPNDLTNYGYSVATNSEGYTYRFAHGVFAETSTDGETTAYYPMYIQIIRPDGTFVFESTEGEEVCSEPNISYTMVNQDIAIANDGSCIISVSDCRKGDNLTYTIYRIDQQGNMMWNGTTLHNGVAPTNSAAMKIVPTADDGAVFAYELFGSYDETTPTKIILEKLDKDGNTVWQDSISSNEENTYPYLVDAGDNQTLLVWAQGANQNLKCRLLDFDGSSAWGEDMAVYSGGFSSNPLWTMMNVVKAKDGVLIAWCDPDLNNGNYENRISYIIRDDGSYAFSDGENGTIVSNDTKVSRMQPDMYYDDEEDAIYCAYYVFNQTYQQVQGIYAQKLSSEGELLWGSEGIGVEPITLQEGDTINQDSLKQLTSPSIRSMGNGNEAVFYLRQDGAYSYNGRVDAYMTVLDKDGNLVGEPKIILPKDESTKNALEVSQLIDGSYFVIVWEDVVPNGTDEEGKTIYATNVQAARVYLNGVTDKISSTDSEVVKQLLRQETYSVDGKQTTGFQRGLNIVKNVYSDGTVTTKKVIK